MKLTEHIFLVGSGEIGISNEHDCNVYVIDCKREAVMIDAGAGLDIDSLLNNATNSGVDIGKLKKLLLTHGHADHAGGAAELKRRLGLSVYANRREARLIEEGDERALGLDIAKRSGLYFPEYRFTPCKVDVFITHNQKIIAGGLEIRAINVPGHSPGSTCYLVDLPEGRALFTGDVVFPHGVIGFMNCKGASLAGYRRFLRRLSGLEVDLLLPGHRGFVLKRGQAHIDQAVEAVSDLHVPKSFL